MSVLTIELCRIKTARGPDFDMIIKDIIIEFFTRKIGEKEVLYVVLGISLLTYVIVSIFPEEKAIRFHRYAYLYDWDKEYDAYKTVKKTKIFTLQLSLYSLLVLILGYIFGNRILKVGFWLFFPIALIFTIIRGDFVKRQ